MTPPEVSWMAQARCAKVSDWLGQPTDVQLLDCRRCPVYRECLTYASQTGATETVYGGIRIGLRPIQAWEVDEAEDPWESI